MKVNDLPALNFDADQMIAQFDPTVSLHDLASMDTTMIRVTTDDGSLVTAIPGLLIRQIVFEGNAYVVQFFMPTESVTLKAIANLSTQVEELRQEISTAKISASDTSTPAADSGTADSGASADSGSNVVEFPSSGDSASGDTAGSGEASGSGTLDPTTETPASDTPASDSDSETPASVSGAPEPSAN